METCKLSYPLPGPDGPIGELRAMRRLTFGDLIDADGHEPLEQSAILIAALTGVPLPIVRRIDLADLPAVEAWLAPFVPGSGPGTPALSAEGS